jgi:hypothetical protein
MAMTIRLFSSALAISSGEMVGGDTCNTASKVSSRFTGDRAKKAADRGSKLSTEYVPKMRLLITETGPGGSLANGGRDQLNTDIEDSRYPGDRKPRSSSVTEFAQASGENASQNRPVEQRRKRQKKQDGYDLHCGLRHQRCGSTLVVLM